MASGEEDNGAWDFRRSYGTVRALQQCLSANRPQPAGLAVALHADASVAVWDGACSHRYEGGVRSAAVPGRSIRRVESLRAYSTMGVSKTR